jgi:nucleoside-diphosphate-sugar epimerase
MIARVECCGLLNNTEGGYADLVYFKSIKSHPKLRVRARLKTIYTDPRPTDIRHGYADISKAEKILGYNPKFSIKKV